MTTEDRADNVFLTLLDEWNRAYDDFRTVCDRLVMNPEMHAREGLVGQDWFRKYEAAWSALQEAFHPLSMYKGWDKQL